MWTCPKCGRRFARRNQFHTYVSMTIDEHFRDKPAKFRDLFDLLFDNLERFGELRVDSVKSAINLGARPHFAMVYVLKNGVRLEFVLDRRVESPRITKVTQLGNESFLHHVTLENASDINIELLGWLREAHENSAA